MSKTDTVTLAAAHHIRDTCLCLNVQRAARALARRFDDALRPCGLTHGQFSLLVAISRPVPHPLGPVAVMLAMDRTTLTAAVKPLQRRRLVRVAVSKEDRRSRVLSLTAQGRRVLDTALPVWRATHDAIEPALQEPDRLRAGLRALAGMG